MAVIIEIIDVFNLGENTKNRLAVLDKLLEHSGFTALSGLLTVVLVHHCGILAKFSYTHYLSLTVHGGKYYFSSRLCKILKSAAVITLNSKLVNPSPHACVTFALSKADYYDHLYHSNQQLTVF
jgi:hypothetical protein